MEGNLPCVPHRMVVRLLTAPAQAADCIHLLLCEICGCHM
jgi:hypothetical protein